MSNITGMRDPKEIVELSKKNTMNILLQSQ